MNIILSYKSNLPEPLKKEKLNDLFIKYQDGDMLAREEIIIHNARLISSVIEKINNNYSDKEELFSIGMIGLIKAVDTFDLGKNLSFANYACICIKNEMLMFFRKNNRKEINDISLLDDKIYLYIINNIPDISIDIADDYEKKVIYKVIHETISQLSFLERFVIIKSFGLYGEEILTQEKIGKLIGFGHSYVSKIKLNGLKIIKQRLSELNYILNNVEPDIIEEKKKIEEDAIMNILDIINNHKTKKV